MIPTTQASLNELLRRHAPPGHRLLELGADATSARGLREALPGYDYTGLDLSPDAEATTMGVVQGDANNMRDFADASFDAVVTSSMFEHDPRFWLTLVEVRRILVPGGHFYVSVPGFAGRISRGARFARRARNWFNARGRTRLGALADKAVATRTYPFHMGPHDYYRFSPTAVDRVLLDGYRTLELRTVLSPPRVQAVGKAVVDDVQP